MTVAAEAAPALAETHLGPLLLPGPRVEPLTQPTAGTSDPLFLLDRLEDARTIKIEMSEQGRFDFSALTEAGGEIAACDAALMPTAPLLSQYAPLPFVATLEVGQAGAALSAAEDLHASVADLKAGDLAIRLGTDVDFRLGAALAQEPVQVAQQVELPLEFRWRRTSVELDLLRLMPVEWDLGLLQDLQPRPGGESIFKIGARTDLLSAELRRDRSYLVGDLSLHPPSEPDALQPRASIRLREHDDFLTAELHASLKLAQELTSDRCLDFVLEYASAPVNLGLFDAGALPAQRITFRLVY